MRHTINVIKGKAKSSLYPYRQNLQHVTKNLTPIVRDNHRILVLIALLVFFIAFSSGGQEQATKERPLPLVHVAAASYHKIHETIPFVGTLVSKNSGVIASRIDGPVEDMPFDVGDRVEKGTTLIQITPRRMKARERLAAAQAIEAAAALKSAQSSLTLSQKRLERLDELKGSAAFSAARQEDAQIEKQRMLGNLEQAQARLMSAKANHENAQLDLEWSRLKAPYSGIVTKRHTQEGAWLRTGDPIVSIVNDSHIEIEVHVAAKYAPFLAEQMALDYRIDNSQKRYQARLRALLPQENSLTRTRTVRLLPNAIPAHAAVGSPVHVDVPVAQEQQALLIPKDALIFQQDKYLVYVIDGENTAQPRYVTLGNPQDSSYEILSGLQENDYVVIKGNERLFPGQKVRIGETNPKTLSQRP